MIDEEKLRTLLYCLVSGIEDAKGFTEEEAEEMRDLINKAIKKEEIVP